MEIARDKRPIMFEALNIFNVWDYNRRTKSAVDSGGLGGLFQSPPESASADALPDWLVDLIGSAADPPRTKSADYSPQRFYQDTDLS